ncbi:MAG: putative transporter substrate-binding protein [Herminiimonas sp.]|nr:putative transporter substrate-binding protein [Herminiimonas sp.]
MNLITTHRLFRRTLACGLCLLLTATFPAKNAHSQTMQSMASYQGKDREQKLMEAAQKEGSLLLYTAMPREYVMRLNEPFEKKYGIKVKVWQAVGESILQRVLNESRSAPVVDVVHSTSTYLEALSRENVLQEIHSPVQKTLLPAALPKHHMYASDLQYVVVQAYNTNKVKKEDLPKTYQDLLDPKWKGKLSIEASDNDWLASVISDMGTEKGTQFFKDLVANNTLSVRQGHTLMVSLVAAGEVPLALTVYQYAAEQARKKGAPVDWFAIEPAVSIFSGIGVAKKAPHPNAALLYYDYMLGPDAQAILAKIGYPPTSTLVESPVKGIEIKYLDGAALLNGQAKSEAQFKTLINSSR